MFIESPSFPGFPLSGNSFQPAQGVCSLMTDFAVGIMQRIFQGRLHRKEIARTVRNRRGEERRLKRGLSLMK